MSAHKILNYSASRKQRNEFDSRFLTVRDRLDNSLNLERRSLSPGTNQEMQTSSQKKIIPRVVESRANKNNRTDQKKTAPFMDRTNQFYERNSESFVLKNSPFKYNINHYSPTSVRFPPAYPLQKSFTKNHSPNSLVNVRGGSLEKKEYVVPLTHTHAHAHTHIQQTNLQSNVQPQMVQMKHSRTPQKFFVGKKENVNQMHEHLEHFENVEQQPIEHKKKRDEVKRAGRGMPKKEEPQPQVEKNENHLEIDSFKEHLKIELQEKLNTLLQDKEKYFIFIKKIK